MLCWSLLDRNKATLNSKSNSGVQARSQVVLVINYPLLQRCMIHWRLNSVHSYPQNYMKARVVKFMLWPLVGPTPKVPNLVEISFVVSEMKHADKCNLSIVCSFCGHLTTNACLIQSNSDVFYEEVLNVLNETS
jgi:hypothetical protein